jgi:hypothetical protein
MSEIKHLFSPRERVLKLIHPFRDKDVDLSLVFLRRTQAKLPRLSESDRTRGQTDSRDKQSSS